MYVFGHVQVDQVPTTLTSCILAKAAAATCYYRQQLIRLTSCVPKALGHVFCHVQVTRCQPSFWVTNQPMLRGRKAPGIGGIHAVFSYHQPVFLVLLWKKPVSLR